MTPIQAIVLAEDMGHAMKKYAKSENAIIDNFKKVHRRQVWEYLQRYLYF